MVVVLFWRALLEVMMQIRQNEQIVPLSGEAVTAEPCTAEREVDYLRYDRSTKNGKQHSHYKYGKYKGGDRQDLRTI